MTDIQASLGVTQMERADLILGERQSLAGNYDKTLNEQNFFQLPFRHHDYIHGYQSYPTVFDIKNVNINSIPDLNKKRNTFMEALQSNGISTRPATHAVHMLKYYKNKYKIEPEDFPNSYIANEVSISFPLSSCKSSLTILSFSIAVSSFIFSGSFKCILSCLKLIGTFLS